MANRESLHESEAWDIPQTGDARLRHQGPITKHQINNQIPIGDESGWSWLLRLVNSQVMPGAHSGG